MGAAGSPPFAAFALHLRKGNGEGDSRRNMCSILHIFRKKIKIICNLVGRNVFLKRFNKKCFFVHEILKRFKKEPR